MFMFSFRVSLDANMVMLAQPPEGNVVHQTVGVSMFSIVSR